MAAFLTRLGVERALTARLQAWAYTFSHFRST
jgi:hypothetical protein